MGFQRPGHKATWTTLHIGRLQIAKGKTVPKLFFCSANGRILDHVKSTERFEVRFDNASGFCDGAAVTYLSKGGLAW